MFDKQQLRWLLRVLCDPPFLRLYVEADECGDGGPELTLADVEHAFWSLPADDEHPEKSRKESWKALMEVAGRGDASPKKLRSVDLFKRVRESVRDRLSARAQHQIPHPSSFEDTKRATRAADLLFPAKDSIRNLPSFYGLDFLFREEPPADPIPLGFDKGLLRRLVETHAHFRGSVPIETLWMRLMVDARLRAAHRRGKRSICAGTWERTRAELLTRASGYCERIQATTGLNTESCEAHDQAINHALDRTGTDKDPIEATAAVAFLAVRAEFGRHLTVQRGAIGLTSFTDAYDCFSRAAKRSKGRGPARVKLVRDDIDQIRAVLREFHRRGVRAIELRPTAEDTRIELQTKLRPLILGYLCHLQETDEPVALGLVLSLFKQAVAKDVAKCRGHVDGSTADPWFDAQRELWQRQVHGLLDVLEHVPALRLFVVGLDAAGREQGCPVRSLAPAFKILRSYHQEHGVDRHTPGRRIQERWLCDLQTRSRSEALGHDPLQRAQQLWEHLNGAKLEGLQPLSPITPIRLGVTMHAGEDFVDPVSGLREIWEAIDFLDLRNGDRLGHALAAALNPSLLAELLKRRGDSSFRFVEKLPRSLHFRITKPLGVHLLDEAWVFERLRECAPLPEAPRPGNLLHTAGHAFAVPAEATALSGHLGRSLPANALVPGLYFYEMEKLPPDLLTQVTIDEAYFRRFELLRLRVLEQICARGLFVESCPTSNIVVAGLHTPPLETFLQDIPMNVTVASDDPAIFNAWPDHELAVYGRDRSDRLIQNSRRASFI